MLDFSTLVNIVLRNSGKHCQQAEYIVRAEYYKGHVGDHVSKDFESIRRPSWRGATGAGCSQRSI